MSRMRTHWNINKKKVELLYDYLIETELHIVFRLNWKIQTISVSHYLDHYKRILPNVSTFKFDHNKEFITPKRIMASPTTAADNSEKVNIFL